MTTVSERPPSVGDVITGWRPGQKIPTPAFDNWRDIHTFAQWLAENEFIPADLRARAAEHVAIADRELSFWAAVADACADADLLRDDE